MLKKMIFMVGAILITLSTIVFPEAAGIFDSPIGPGLTPVTEWTATLSASPTKDDPSSPIYTPTSSTVNTLQPTPSKTRTPIPSATFTKTATTVPIKPTNTNTLIFPTRTKTNTVVPPTATKTNTPVPQLPTKTSTILPPTPTRTLVPYKFQPVTPVFLSNFAYPDEGCAWQGVAGQVFDKTGNPVNNLIVKITGTWNGKKVSLIGVTGMVTGKPYGSGGYEIVLGSKAVNTFEQLRIQVLDAAYNPMTYRLKFNTSADCGKNLLIINFLQR